MSRLGRDYLQVGMYTDIVFPEFGVHFIAVNDGIDSTRGENEFAAIRNIFNEMFARDTSKKIRATWQSKGKSGERLCTNPPYGYTKDPDDRKKWIIDEEAAAVVQMMFSLCMDGMGTTQIAKWLCKNKIMMPTAYWQSKEINRPVKQVQDPYKWSSEVISKILGRMEYLGHTVNFKTYRESYKKKEKLYNAPDKWAVFENTHDPIIEENVFLIVQNIRQSRRRRTKMGDMGMFSGLLYCGDCGGKMYLCRATNFKPEQAYYLCSTYRKDRELCTTHTIRNMVLAEIVLRNLREAIVYVTENEDDFTREAADRAVQEHNREFMAKKDILAKTEKRIAELDVIIKRLYEDNVAEKLTDERFVKLSRDYEQEQKTLKISAETMRQDVKEQEQKKSNAKSFIATAKKYADLNTLDVTVLHEFIDRIEISATDTKSRERKIHIVYNFMGAFDFEAAAENTKSKKDKKKTA